MLHTNTYSKDFGSIALQNLKPIHRGAFRNIPCHTSTALACGSDRECPSHSKHAAGIMAQDASSAHWSPRPRARAARHAPCAMWSQVSGPSSKALTLAQHARDLRPEVEPLQKSGRVGPAVGIRRAHPLGVLWLHLLLLLAVHVAQMEVDLGSQVELL